MKTTQTLALALLGLILSAPAVFGQAPAGPPAALAGPPVRQSWTSDTRELDLGHIVTVLIDEQTLASADKEVTALRDRSRDLGVTVNSSGGGLRTNNDVSDRQRGESSRRERFVAEISARIVEKGPGDVLKIEGLKKLQIDEHEQEVTIRGWVRSSDVTISNTVESWRIADAEILYDSNEELGKAGGFWSKLFDLIIP
ncbi:MAG: flagellar basal body L-ring protein FlgH [Longimicrobiales bacterium]